MLDAQNAAKVLGHAKNTWDNDLWVPIEDASWNDMTQSQKNAASVLGYNRQTWDGTVDVDDNIFVNMTDINYMDMYWLSLPKGAFFFFLFLV